MQFKILFKLKQPGQLLPLSYQYELSSWIYKLIRSSNSDFGKFLHDKGYTSRNKRFKLFTFSSLHIPPKFEIIGDRMKIYCLEISFVVSFLVEQAAKEMIIGLFQNQELKLGDRISQVDLIVKQVQPLEALSIGNSAVKLRTTSPILVSEPEINQHGKLCHNYLHPTDEKYEQYFIKNLKDKYETALKYQLIPAPQVDQTISFRLLTENPKKRGIRIKVFTPTETKIIGYLFDFEIIASPEMIRMGILAGFGGENALGFGATRILN